MLCQAESALRTKERFFLVEQEKDTGNNSYPDSECRTRKKAEKVSCFSPSEKRREPLIFSLGPDTSFSAKSTKLLAFLLSRKRHSACKGALLPRLSPDFLRFEHRFLSS